VRGVDEGGGVVDSCGGGVGGRGWFWVGGRGDVGRRGVGFGEEGDVWVSKGGVEREE